MLLVARMGAQAASAVPALVSALEQAADNPMLHITPTGGESGTLVGVIASGFPPNTPVSVGMGPANAGFGQVAEGTTDANGVFIAHVPAQGSLGMMLVQ